MKIGLLFVAWRVPVEKASRPSAAFRFVESTCLVRNLASLLLVHEVVRVLRACILHREPGVFRRAHRGETLSRGPTPTPRATGTEAPACRT